VTGRHSRTGDANGITERLQAVRAGLAIIGRGHIVPSHPKGSRARSAIVRLQAIRPGRRVWQSGDLTDQGRPGVRPRSHPANGIADQAANLPGQGADPRSGALPRGDGALRRPDAVRLGLG